jgi:hypothetical protein
MSKTKELLQNHIDEMGELYFEDDYWYQYQLEYEMYEQYYESEQYINQYI